MALKILLDIPWGVGFNKALKICQEKKNLKIVKVEKKTSIEVLGKCDDTDFRAQFIFKGFLKKLQSIALDVLLKNSQKKDKDITQMVVDDFLRTYYVIVEMFGKENIERGISIEELKDLDYLGGTNLEKLPYFEWIKGETRLKHCFVDKEGIVISTTLEPKK